MSQSDIHLDKLQSIFCTLGCGVINDIWENLKGDGTACLKLCCEMSGMTYEDALSQLSSTSDDKIFCKARKPRMSDVNIPHSSSPQQQPQQHWARPKVSTPRLSSPNKTPPAHQPSCHTPLSGVAVAPRSPQQQCAVSSPLHVMSPPLQDSPAAGIVIPKVCPDQKEKVIKYHYDVKSDSWTQLNAFVYIHPVPFQEGTMRTAFHLFDLSLPDGKQHFVCKMSKDPKEDTSTYFDDVEMQAFSKLFADEFNKLNVVKKIDFVEASLIKCLERRNQPILAVEPFLNGKYIKHSNNFGFVSEEDRNTPQAFSHYSYCKSKGEYLICDIQGVEDKYTDPQVHSKNGKGFGKGNMGVEGMAKFFQTHRCNAICTSLHLPPHQPKQVDTGTVGGKQLTQPKQQLSPLERKTSIPHDLSAISKCVSQSPHSNSSTNNTPLARNGDSDLETHARQLFQQFDKDGRGVIDRDGLVLLCAKLGRKTTSKEATEIITIVSSNRREGLLDFPSFIAWWTASMHAESF